MRIHKYMTWHITWFSWSLYDQCWLAELSPLADCLLNKGVREEESIDEDKAEASE